MAVLPGTAQQRYQGIGSLIVSARRLGEYREMFALSDADLLGGPVLDVAGGASSFLADLVALGGTGCAVDPHYHRPAAELTAAADRGAALARTAITTWPELYAEHVADAPVAHLAEWQHNLRRFEAHYRPDSAHYRAASLPVLPFADGEFRIALSSHLLFSYPDDFGHDLLLASIAEMVRVSALEARVYPLVDTMGRPYPELDRLRADLAERGVDTELRPVPFRLFKSGTHAFVARRAA
ncbi:hypothetical protein L6E12_23510 [Actinokineospora sp. PR83]|uniref:hypothetical protein n=1 Tax=Actinokineospora sp. PR83 TaxID=2884908 RepID=UPI001F234AC6|nr:hypothetical protein [Actinokineospora sp. PR83]MCG8918753.1 hypothetical protein [Actinokineospora sp. PR83]